MILFLSLLCQQITLTYAQTEEQLTVISKTNPKTVNAGENFRLNIFITNEGNTSAELTSISLISPLEKRPVELLDQPQILDQNKIFNMAEDFSVPWNTIAGEYELAVLARTKSSDYIGYTELTVNTIQRIV
jgi:hypothetical protein